MRADLPPNPTAEFGGDGTEPNEEPDEWRRKTEDILKNLPRGVDKQAAQNILNEIVIQGDEVHWDDVAGLEIAKSALKETVVYPFLRLICSWACENLPGVCYSLDRWYG